MSSSPESSCSLKSQVSFRSDSCDTHWGANGQGRDAEQAHQSILAILPIESSFEHHDTAEHDVSVSVRNPIHQVMNSAPTSTAQQLQYALGGKPQAAHVAPYSKHNPLGRGTLASAKDSDCTSSATNEFLTQVQLAAPTQNASSIEPKVTSPKSSKPIHDSKPADLMSLALRYDIDVGLNNRIASRMCRISKAQEELLESNEKWYPPLVGSTGRRGMVPLSLLNILTARADNLTETLNIASADTPMQTSGLQSHANDGVDSPIRNSPRSDETDSAVDWSPSPSPVTKHDRRPPDSSPEDVYVQDKYRTQLSVSDNPVSKHELIISNDSSGSLNTTQLQNPLDSSTIDDNIGLPVSQYLEKNSKMVQLANAPPGPVQVDRTPYPTRTKLHLDLPQNSITFIPGTFDEKSNHYAEVTVPNTNENSNSRKIKFAAEPSSASDCHLDPGFQDEDINSPSAGPMPSEGKDLVPVTMTGVAKTSISASASHPSIKRQNSEMGSPEKSRQKRTRGAPSYPRQLSEDTGVYTEVDWARRNLRREFFQTLSSERNTREARKTVASSSQAGTPNVSAIGQLDNGKSIPRASSRLNEGFSSSSSLTDAALVSLSEPEGASAQSLSKDPSSEPIPDLFNLFQAAYPAYMGRYDNFSEACQLLRLLCSTSSIHPHVWDAFVFHHYHDYKPYIENAAQRSDSVQSYSDFFNEIDELQCNKRVIHRSRLLEEFTHHSKPSVAVTGAHTEHSVNPSCRPKPRPEQHLPQRGLHHRISPPTRDTNDTLLTTHSHGHSHGDTQGLTCSLCTPERNVTPSESVKHVTINGDSLPRSQLQELVSIHGISSLGQGSNDRSSRQKDAKESSIIEDNIPACIDTVSVAPDAQPTNAHWAPEGVGGGLTSTNHVAGNICREQIAQTTNAQGVDGDTTSGCLSHIISHGFNNDIAMPAEEEVQQFISFFR